MLGSKVLAALVLLVALVGATWASIDNEPVRVTHRNSGPEYDIDVADGAKEAMTAPAWPRLAEQAASGDQEPASVGRVSIRRIFLVPMAQADSASPWAQLQPAMFAGHHSAQQDEQQQPQPEGSSGEPARQPFWPFSPLMRHHLFGSDAASRSPTPEESQERPSAGIERPPAAEREDSEPSGRPLIDPIRMMIDLMQQALSPSGSAGMGSFFNDLNKEASQLGTDSANQREPSRDKSDKPAGSQLEEPAIRPPMSKNETREDVVEIEGKKYLRKTVISRHVGENIIFMTKRLIFVPLNETDTEAVTTTTTATPIAPSTTTIEEQTRKVDEATTTAASTTSAPSTSTTGEVSPSEPVVGVSDTTTTTPSVSSTQASSDKEETTPRVSGLDKEGTDRVGERLMAEAPSSTSKPVASS